MTVVLNPLSLITQIKLNMKPKQEGYKTPLFDFTILLEALSFKVNRLQYFDLIGMLSTIDQMTLSAKYRKYRPLLPMKNNPHLRWKFAYTAVVEGQIRPKRDQFKWECIRNVTRTRRDYIELIKKRHNKSAKITPADLEIERVCAFTFHLFGQKR